MSVQELIEVLEKKYGPRARVKLFTDGSGHLSKSLEDEQMDAVIDFNNLEELKTLL
jgi:hypothetical protein